MAKRKKAAQLRSRILGVKVSESEYEKLVEAAGPYPVSTWARGVLLRELTEDSSALSDTKPKGKR